MSFNKAAWEASDFTTIAAFMRHSGEEVVQSLRITPSMRVLDLCCGDGTTALPLARRGAAVTGIDISPSLLAAGKRRTMEAGLYRLQFHEGDACNLDEVCDNTFDLTLSMFGAIFAPRPSDAAREMVRVTRPGGRIVMGNWIPGDPSFITQLRYLSASFLPPQAAGTLDPLEWGKETNIIERFGMAGVPAKNISLERDIYWFTSPDTPLEEFVATFTRFYESTFAAAQRGNKLNDFHHQLLELAKAQNQSTDGSTHIPANFLRVTVSLVG